MCGIVAMINKENKKNTYCIGDILKTAHYNKHRGNEDGAGLLFTNDINNDTPMVLLKSLLTIDEINNDTLQINPKKHIKERENVGILKLGKHLERFKEFSLIKPKMAVFHHRTASLSLPISIENTHPFKSVDGIYYAHNGTVWGTEILRNFLQINSIINFKTDLDSETLAFLIESYLRRLSYSEKGFKNIKKYIDKVLPYNDFGVLMRIEPKANKILIVSSGSRSLYLVELDTAYFLTSEIPRYVKKFESIIRIDKGVFELSQTGFINISDEFKTKDITEIFKNAITLTPAINECDFCSINKETYMLNHPTLTFTGTIDICLDCYLQENEFDIKSTNKKNEKIKVTFPYEIQNYEIEEEETFIVKDGIKYRSISNDKTIIQYEPITHEPINIESDGFEISDDDINSLISGNVSQSSGIKLSNDDLKKFNTVISTTTFTDIDRDYIG